MGKVQVLTGGKDGQYLIQPVYNEKTYKEMRDAATRQESDAMEQLTQIDSDISTAESELSSAQSALNNALDDLIAGIQNGGPSMTPEYQEAYAKRQNARAHLAGLEALKGIQTVRRDDARRKIAELDAKASPGPRLAWCADFTEDASGEVASIEVPGEPQEPIIIYPQFSEGKHEPERDGLLAPREWQTGAQVYFNAAILPGWQKFKPTYRLATVINVDRPSGTVDIELDQALSSAQGIKVGEAERLFDVPVRYMDCDAYAFSVDDRVVVKCHQEDEPTVIGFEKEPQRCGFELWAWNSFYLADDNVTGSNKIRISDRQIDQSAGVFPLSSSGPFPYRSFERQSSRFAVLNGKFYEAPSTSTAANNIFWADDLAFYSVSADTVTSICTSTDKIFTAYSSGQGQDKTQIQVWSADLEILYQWQIEHFWGGGADEFNEVLYNFAASETEIAIPITRPSGPVILAWYSFNGALQSWFQFSDPYRPNAIASDGTDFAVSVTAFLGFSFNETEVWIYNASHQRTHVLDVGAGVGNRTERVWGIALTKRWLIASMTGLYVIRVFDRENGYTLAAEYQLDDFTWPIDLAVDSAIRTRF